MTHTSIPKQNKMHSPENKQLQLQQQQQHKKRVSKACDCCRKSKTKCDGMRPCTRCLQDNKICTYMSNKKKADKLYPSSYVDLLETRVSILIQSLNKLLEKSKTQGSIDEFMKDPIIYNETGEFDINKVICQLLSSEKLQNLSQSNMNYSIEEITNVASSLSSSSASSSSSATPPTSTPPSVSSTPLNIAIPKRSSHHTDPSSHIHKPQHVKHYHHQQQQQSLIRSPSSTIDLNKNLDSLLYEPLSATDVNNTPDDTHSIDSSLMSPVYSLNDQPGLYLDTWPTDAAGSNIFPKQEQQGEPMGGYGLIKQEQDYRFNWDGFDFGRGSRTVAEVQDGSGAFAFPEF